MSEYKYPLGVDVLTAARCRLDVIYENFDCVSVSFSGGKDSGVLLELAVEAARRSSRLPVKVLIIDLEGQYKHTIQYIERMIKRKEVEATWVCLPLNLRNSISQFRPFWTCWDPHIDSEEWIRPFPSSPGVVTDESFFPFFRRGMEFEEFVPAYAEWLHRSSGAKRTAILVGIRSDESLNRYRTIKSENKTRWRNQGWTTQVAQGVFNAYPIYDWKTEDIWRVNGKMNWDYNHIYDLMHLARLSIHEMRLCQPYGDDQRKGLWLFKILEPETWARIVTRVEGVNFGARHAHSQALGRISVSLPPEHTWESYSKFLLDTMPKPLAKHYSTKLEVFFRWWGERGYPDGIPDAADPKLEAKKKVPSWRRIAKVLMKNDYWCKGLSFSPTKREHEKQLALTLQYLEL